MNHDLINPLLTFIGAVILAALSLPLKRLLARIDGIDTRLIALDAVTQARIHNLDQATQARITGVEQVADAKIRECQTGHTSREDSIVRMVVEHAAEADRKYATAREMITLHERLLAIDNNVRAVLSALDRLVSHGSD